MRNHQYKNVMGKNTYIKAGIWYTVGNVIIKGLPFLTLPLFVRILSTSDFGIYNTYISYENVISVILGLGISGTIKTAKFDYKEKFDQYVSSVYVLLCVPGLIIGLAALSLRKYIYSVVPWLTSCILLALIVHSFSSAVYSINGVKFVIEGKYKLNLLMSLVYTVLNIGMSLWLCLFTFPDDRAMGRITGTVLAMSAVAGVVLVLQFKKEKHFICTPYWDYALKMGVPLVPHLLSLALLSSSDKVMIQSMVGDEEVGIYSLAVNLITVLSVLQNSIENAWAPWFYSSLDKKNYQNIRKANASLIVFYAYLTICFMLLSPEIIRIFSTAEFKDSIYAVVPLSISAFFGFIYLIPVNVEYFYKKTMYISIATIATSLINIVLNYFFIIRFGYIAAAYATCTSRLILLFFHILVARKLNKEINEGGIYGLMVSALVILLGSLTLFCVNLWMIRWGIALLLTIVMGVFVLWKRKIKI